MEWNILKAEHKALLTTVAIGAATIYLITHVEQLAKMFGLPYVGK